MDQESATLTERAEAALEVAIVKGELRPGAKLKIADIAADYGVSQTPAREALSRLASKGLVIAVGQRGFRVAPMSDTDLADITSTRIALEAAALRQSIRHGDAKWEGEIVSCLHQLKRVAGRSRILKNTPELDRVHKLFHAGLIAACSSPRTVGLASQLYDQASRYRNLMLSNAVVAQDFVAEHEALANVVLSRSASAAVTKLTAHLQRTYSDIYGAMPD
ncbi:MULTISPECIES: GntR family transcriptional regulator [unclassified Bradyrhizobium]|uniref:GntR family transcriptional regulator n=1 Tax=unclassified Bradyrhizobium TaxID=2631580 RepID=UPI0004287927|nr:MULTISPECIES: GntR family transcriptional regulator [unclassified Bradyrhizobium]MCP3461660.1 GntR family transcriptional regulator [Bradyrhizobium sp. CCGUVB23]